MHLENYTTIFRKLKVSFTLLGFCMGMLAFAFTQPEAGFGMQKEKEQQSGVYKYITTNGNGNLLISMEVRNATLVEALEQLAEKANVGLAIQAEHVPEKMITTNLRGATVFHALDKLLQGTSLEAVLPSSRDVIIIKKKPDRLKKFIIQTVSGFVTDASTGEALPGVNVIIKGTTQGVSTNAEGEYELEVPSLQDTLIYSFIGYQTQEIPINGRTQIDVELQRQAVIGEDVVVVGYGTQQREKVISGISTVNTEDLGLVDLNTPDAGNLLKGRVSGVQIREGTGAAGSPPSIRVRGTSSINAGVEPLIVVDGFPIGTSFPQSLNPDDIANISVLKDASSTAIYGARASNGVIVIETKQAREGMSEFSYNSRFSIKSLPSNWRPEMLNAEEAVQYNIERIRELDEFNNVSEPTPIPEIFRKGQEALDRGELDNINWLDEFINGGTSAITQNHNISYRGGNENFRAAITGGFLEEKSTIPDDDFQRFSLRTNFDVDITENIDMGVNLVGVRSVDNRVPSDGARSGLWAAITGSPLISPFDEEGNLTKFMRAPAPGFFSRPNPMFQAQETLDELINRDLQANINFEIEIFEGFHYRPRFYVRQLTRETRQFSPTTIGDVSIGGPGALFRGAPPQPNEGSDQTQKLENYGLDNVFTYVQDIQDHHFDITLGQSLQRETSNLERIEGAIFPSDEVVNFGEAGDLDAFSDDFDWSLLAGFGQITYDYKDKYLAEASIRREGSSRLGKNNRFGNFPSGAVGWRISNENFFPEDTFINNFLLRGSFGKTGNNDIGNFDALGQFNSIRNVVGNQVQEGKTLSDISNDELEWETAIQWQLGATIGMLNNSINMKMEFWNKTTKNMLFNINTPRASGFQSTRINLGEMVNKGFDVTINTNKNFNSGLQWNSDFNISWQTNKVTELPPQLERIVLGGRGGTNVIMEGEEVGAFWGLVRDGLFTVEEANDPNATTFADIDAYPGTNNFRDLNGDGVIDRTNDKRVTGDPTPDVIIGFNNQFSYKNFSFSMLLTSSLGYDILPLLRDVDMNTVARWNVSKRVLNRWKSPENPGNGFAPRSEVNAHSREWMDDWLESGNHLWIKNIRFSYSIPGNLVQTLGVSGLRFNFTVDNLARFDNYSGFNPEVSTSDDPARPGLDDFVNPLARTFSFGVNLNL